MRKSAFLSVVLTALLAACGGGGDSDDAFTPPGGGGTTPPPSGPTVATLNVVTSVPSLPSDGATTATISATALDATNRVVEDATVIFSTSSGQIAAGAGSVTNEDGVATATLSTGNDPSARTITVTATVGTVSSTVTVLVTGTRVTVQGPTSLEVAAVGTYTVSLLDSSNNAIPNRALTITSARGNPLNPATVTTNGTGTGTFTLTANSPSADTITVSGAGVTATAAVAVNSDSFAFTAPTANAEVALATPTPVTLRWFSSGVPVQGQVVSFAVTRGSLSAPTATTNSLGIATVDVQSASAGGAVVTATAGVATASRVFEFVASTPASVDLQPSLFSISTGQTSLLTATVRDAAGNLVKNATVNFSLVDVSGGNLSRASAITDSQGSAQVTYTAGNTTSASNGVQITATVGAFNDMVALTVGGREVFISLGTGNEIEEPNAAQYSIEYAAQVTDANGNGVPNVPLSVAIKSVSYIKGSRGFDNVADRWVTNPSAAACVDEDADKDGVLDFNEDTDNDGIFDPGEDTNGDGLFAASEDINRNGRIEAGNIATVSPTAITTNANGFAIITVTYPQDHAEWVNVELAARTSVQGTEYARAVRFLLPISADDVDDDNNTPPGVFSPFGQAGLCTIAN